jgi:hypothetical protein
MALWDAIHQVAPFAYRVLVEIDSYVEGAIHLQVPWEEALDEQILQKILPKLKGVDQQLEPAFRALVELTADNFPLSHAKLLKMQTGYLHHGFASYF